MPPGPPLGGISGRQALLSITLIFVLGLMIGIGIGLAF